MASSIFVDSGGMGGGSQNSEFIAQSLTINDPTAPANQRIWKLFNQGGTLMIASFSDANANTGRWVSIEPYAGTMVNAQGKFEAVATRTTFHQLTPTSISQLVGVISPVLGILVQINDSTTNTVGAVIAGGGSFNVLARGDGTNWRVIQ